MSHFAEFGIAVVSKQTGISAHRLRAWERRYPSLLVGRSDTGRRRYTEQDIARLKSIKSLIDNGYKISEVSALSQNELSQLCQQLGPASNGSASNGSAPFGSIPVGSDGDKSTPQASHINIPPNQRVLTCGHAIPQQLSERLKQNQSLNLDTQLRNFSQLSEATADSQFDIAILQVETISASDLSYLREFHRNKPVHSVFLIFHYGLRELVEELKSYGFHLWKAPFNASELYQAIYQSSNKTDAPTIDIDSSGMAPEHIFNPSQLNKLSNVSTAIDCECPKHISELIQSLCAFESYSQQCENRNEEDAALHRRIYLQTAKARYTMEKMLQQVIDAENIRL